MKFLIILSKSVIPVLIVCILDYYLRFPEWLRIGGYCLLFGVVQYRFPNNKPSLSKKLNIVVGIIGGLSLVILMLSLVVVILDNGVIKLISCTLCMLAFTYFGVLIFNAKGRKTRKME